MGLLDFLRGTPTEARYAAKLMRGIREAGETRELLYIPDQSKIAIRGDEKRWMYLGNVFAEYCQCPRRDRNGALAMQVQSWFATENTLPSDFTEAAGNLVPRVRERAFWPLTQLVLQLEGHEGANYHGTPLTEHLMVSVVYDWPSSMCEVGEETFKDWGVTFDYALDQATRNLARMSEHDFEEVAPEVYVAPWNDSYQSSRLVLTDRIAKLRLKGQPVATVPSRAELIICGSEDPAGLEVLAKVTAEVFDNDARPMSAIPIRLDGDRWEPFLPPENHPSHTDIKTLWIKSLLRDYTEQKSLLDQLHEKEGKDLFVASYTGVQKDDGSVCSYSVLGKDVDMLLPRTESVVLMERPDAEDSVWVDWELLTATVGDILEPTDLYPPRYRVLRFPTDEELDVLRERSTSATT